MLFFRNLRIFTALVLLVIITIIAVIAVITTSLLIRKAKKKQTKISKRKSIMLRMIEITLAAFMGFMIADTTMTGLAVKTAFSHGMSPVPETDPDNGGKYVNTLGDVTYFNEYTYPEADIDKNADLTGKILIYVRYDCPDCHILYNDMPKPTDDILYIYSRTKLGLAIMDKYGIELTEVPSAVYISPQGTIYIQTLAGGTGDDMYFNMTGWQEIISLKYESQ